MGNVFQFFALTEKQHNMANTFSQLFVQVVFAVKHRQNIIRENHRDEIEKFICGISNQLGAKPYAIYCNPDHLHLFVSMKPSLSVSNLVKEVKRVSTTFIKEKRLCHPSFSWQIGYSCFSYSLSQVPSVCKYIENQHEHHRKKTFEEEYVNFLKHFKIEYNEKYLFDWDDA